MSLFYEENSLNRSDPEFAFLALDHGMEERDLCFKLLIKDSKLFMEQHGPV